MNTIAFLDPFQDPCADQAYSSFAFAVTIVWHNTSTGEILDADMMINDQLATRRFAGGPYANCPDSGCPAGNPGRGRFGQHRDARGRALHRHRALGE